MEALRSHWSCLGESPVIQWERRPI